MAPAPSRAAPDFGCAGPAPHDIAHRYVPNWTHPDRQSSLSRCNKMSITFSRVSTALYCRAALTALLARQGASQALAGLFGSSEASDDGVGKPSPALMGPRARRGWSRVFLRRPDHLPASRNNRPRRLVQMSPAARANLCRIDRRLDH